MAFEGLARRGRSRSGAEKKTERRWGHFCGDWPYSHDWGVAGTDFFLLIMVSALGRRGEPEKTWRGDTMAAAFCRDEESEDSDCWTFCDLA